MQFGFFSTNVRGKNDILNKKGMIYLFQTVLRGKKKINKQFSHFGFHNCRLNFPQKNTICSSVSFRWDKFTSVKYVYLVKYIYFG